MYIIFNIILFSRCKIISIVVFNNNNKKKKRDNVLQNKDKFRYNVYRMD